MTLYGTTNIYRIQMSEYIDTVNVSNQNYINTFCKNKEWANKDKIADNTKVSEVNGVKKSKRDEEKRQKVK